MWSLSGLRLQAGVEDVGIDIAQVGLTEIGDLFGPKEFIELVVVDTRSDDQPRGHQGVHVPQLTFGYVFGEARLDALKDRQEPFPNRGEGNCASLQGCIQEDALNFGRVEVGVNQGFESRRQ